eukprot:snap_masked-scaffold_7-processed-gene-6.24-mRNA-1 protein AED:0.03 eAED:0.03 QI:0/-1/0/1/-1/1/1/0/655
MCGIGLIIKRKGDEYNYNLITNITKILKRRGPDFQSEVEISTQFHEMKFFGSVLAIRKGNKKEIQEQPMCDTKGNVLVFNGEIYNTPEGIGDTNFVFDTLRKAESTAVLIQDLKSFKGPYALIFYSAKFEKIFFCRDFTGRRSLLLNQKGNQFVLSSQAVCSCGDIFQCNPTSCSTFTGWKSVQAGVNVHCVNLKQNILEVCVLKRHANIEFSLPESFVIAKQNLNFSDDGLNNEQKIVLNEANILYKALFFATKERIEQIYFCTIDGSRVKKVGLMFSGGLDSTLLAYLILSQQLGQESTELDLLSVCFDEPNQFLSCDRKQSILMYKKLKSIFPTSKIKLILINVSQEEVKVNEKTIYRLIYPRTKHMDFNVGAAFFFAVQGKGLLYEEPHCFIKTHNVGNEIHQSNLRKLLSIDIENPPIIQKIKSTITCSCGKVAKSGCRFSLCKFCCKNMQSQTRKRCSSHKLRPFDLKRLKIIYKEEKAVPIDADEVVVDYSKLRKYSSVCKVLLSGLGADELLGGYGTHRKEFLYRGYTGVEKEIEIRKNEIEKRNLGRDDRIISYHGKEIRYPFLAEEVFSVLEEISIKSKVNFSLEKRFGGKRILRLIGFLLGLEDCACFEKRAIQFGSGIAKIHDTNHFGSRGKFDKDAHYIIKD